MVAALLLAALATSETSFAARNLAEPQSRAWIGSQFALLSALTLANVASFTLGHPASSAAADFEYFGEKNVLRGLHEGSSRVSDGAAAVGLVAPFIAFAPAGRVEAAQASLVYGEVLQFSLLANTVTKRSVRRLRPAARSLVAQAVEPGAADAYYSFYSGHSALSFSAASGGSLLFSALHGEDDRSVIAYSGASFFLAGFVAHARVRAGKHYPSDVAVGSLAGLLASATVVAAHRISTQATPLRVASALAGASLGLLSAYALPTRVLRRRDRGGWTVAPSLVPQVRGAVLSLSARRRQSSNVD